MKVFTHEDFYDISKSLFQMAMHPGSLGQSFIHDDEAYKEACRALWEDIQTKERLVVDLDVLPVDKTLNDMRLPHDFMLIGLETEFEEEKFAAGFYPLEAMAVTRYTPEDDEELVIVPLVTGHKKGWWNPSGVVIHIRDLDASKDAMAVKIQGFPGSRMNEENAKDISAVALQCINSIASILNCSNITTEIKEPSTLRKNRAKKNNIELQSFNIIKLPGEVHTYNKSQGGSHASPRFHTRRGHYRTLHRGERYEERIWVKPCAVGNPEGPKIEHDYIVRK